MTMAALFSALETHQSQLKPEEEKALVKTVISSLFEEADSGQVDTDDRLVNFLGDEEDIEYKVNLDCSISISLLVSRGKLL